MKAYVYVKSCILRLLSMIIVTGNELLMNPFVFEMNSFKTTNSGWDAAANCCWGQ